MSLQEAAKRRFKGKYAGPDKYKGVIPNHLKGKYKGKYFGKEADKGSSNHDDTTFKVPEQPRKRTQIPDDKFQIKPIGRKRKKKTLITTPVKKVHAL